MPPAVNTQRSTTLSRYLTFAIFATLSVLLVEVLLESWIQELLSDRVEVANGKVTGELVNWPKDLKNGLYLLLAALTLAQVALQRRWRDFATRADLALLVLAGIMVVAGVLGTSGPQLIAEAVFVYLRGVIVFYAVRTLLQPGQRLISRRTIEPMVWVLGGLVALNVVVAIVQMFVGLPAFSGLGWVDLFQARDYRSQGLLDHPNHLGQLVGLAIIGMFAWMSGQERPGRWAWAVFGVLALGLASTQSRQSVAGVLAAIALIWFLRRGRAGDKRPGRPGRTAVIAAVVVFVLAVGHVLVRPGNLAELGYRLRGVVGAVEMPSGTESDCHATADPQACLQTPREIRVLFFQQGARLFAARPVLGYGVGQFGGIVADKHDPNWEQDPRFPGGFNLYGFDGKTVDSFWLHLTVETGALGLLVYLAWLWLLLVPLLLATRRFAGRRVWGAGPATGAGEPRDRRRAATVLWGAGAVLFSVVISTLSNSLEDALYPPLLFLVLGLAWVAGDVRHAEQPR